MSHHHRHNDNNGSEGSGNQDMGFQNRLRNFIGETVTIFTTSGGASGSGFTGVLLSVHSDFVRLMIGQGSGSSSPLADGSVMESQTLHTAGTIYDIPINRIAAFSHNAI